MTDTDYYPSCPVCEEPIDYCPGHGASEPHEFVARLMLNGEPTAMCRVCGEFAEAHEVVE